MRNAEQQQNPFQMASARKHGEEVMESETKSGDEPSKSSGPPWTRLEIHAHLLPNFPSDASPPAGSGLKSLEPKRRVIHPGTFKFTGPTGSSHI